MDPLKPGALDAFLMRNLQAMKAAATQQDDRQLQQPNATSSEPFIFDRALNDLSPSDSKTTLPGFA